MSIKGNFSDISFVELVKIVSKFNGRLGIWNFIEKKQYECFLKDGHFIYINCNGQSILDVPLMNTFLSEMSLDKSSYYSFIKDAILDSPPHLKLPISKILSTSILINSNSDETDEKLLYPNIQTKFEISPLFSGNFVGEIGQFYNLCAAHLHAGCSAEYIADMFGLEIKEVQRNFHKLRKVGAIKPVRLFNVPNISANSQSVSENLQRLIELRKKLNPNSAIPAPTQPTNINPTAVTNTTTQSIQPRRIETFLPNPPVSNLPIPKPSDPKPANETNSTYRTVQSTAAPQSFQVQPNSPPEAVFDLTKIEKQSIFKRMLSSLFSKRIQT